MLQVIEMSFKCVFTMLNLRLDELYSCFRCSSVLLYSGVPATLSYVEVELATLRAHHRFSLPPSGETIAIVAKINNSSSSEMTPKFKLICDVVYRAQGNTKHESSTVASAADHCVASQTHRTVSCALQIPGNLILSIQNCDIITVEYRLKVRDGLVVLIIFSRSDAFLLHRILMNMWASFFFFSFSSSGLLGYQLCF